MDFARLIAILVVVVSCFGVLTHQKPQAADTADTILASEPSSNVTDKVEDNNTVPAVVANNCTTAKGLEGTCVQRQTCDHSTYAIDLTLYAPHGYKKNCTIEEVCCPFDSLIRVETTNQQNLDEENYNFDDDE